jgi:general secretion pathway protein J
MTHGRSTAIGRMQGFTLLEVLAALVLLALLMLGVYGGIRTATHTAHAGEAAIERLDAMRSTQQFLRHDVAHMLALPWARDTSGHAGVFTGASTRMRYVAPLPGYLGRLGPQLQTLQLVREGTGYRLQIAFALLPPDGTAPRPFGRPEVLLRGIRRGQFAFRGFVAQGHPGDWQSSWSDDRRMPALVQVKLDLVDGRWPVLHVPVRVDAMAIDGLLKLPSATLDSMETPP